jgi:tyrosyl-tRNA synthetase
MRKNNNNYHRITADVGALLGLTELLVTQQLAKSRSEVRREVEKGGLYLNNRKVELA